MLSPLPAAVWHVRLGPTTTRWTLRSCAAAPVPSFFTGTACHARNRPAKCARWVSSTATVQPDMACEAVASQDVQERLKAAGWSVGPGEKHVFAEQTHQNMRMDYVCYEEPVHEYNDAKKPPLMAIEVKRTDVYNHERKREEAMNKTIEYCHMTGCPISCVTDGTKWWYKHAGNAGAGPPFADLTVGGEMLAEDVVLPPEVARGFRDGSDFDERELLTRETTTVLPHSKEQLIQVFEEANNLLATVGVRAGAPRVQEIARWLFLRLTDHKPASGKRDKTCWEYLVGAEDPLQIVNGLLLPDVQNAFGSKGFEFGQSAIQNEIRNTATVRDLVGCLDKISSADRSDQAGQAFEFLFMHVMHSKTDFGNEFGEYFTPRDVTKAAASLISRDLKPGDKVFDPFCGTGGFLMAIYSELADKPEFLTQANRKKLRRDTFFGTERQSDTAEIAKMNFILRGDGHSGITKGDTFACYKGYDPKNEYICEEKYDTVVTNIPFGVQIPYTGGHYSKEISERYCALRCLNAAEPGGRVVMIVSPGLMTREKDLDREFREELLSRAKVELLVKLPKGTFAPYTETESYMVYATDVRRQPPFYRQKSEVPWYYDWDGNEDLSDVLVNFREKTQSLVEHGFEKAKLDSKARVWPVPPNLPQGSCFAQLVKDNIIENYLGKRISVEKCKWQSIDEAQTSGCAFYPVLGGGRKPKAYHDVPTDNDPDGVEHDRWVVYISLRGSAGHTALYRANEIYAADHSSLWWSNDQEVIMTEFLFIALQRAFLPQYKRGGGSQGLTATDIIELVEKIDIPSLDEQREEVEKLHKWVTLYKQAQEQTLEVDKELRTLFRWSEAPPKLTAGIAPGRKPLLQGAELFNGFGLPK